MKDIEARFYMDRIERSVTRDVKNVPTKLKCKICKTIIRPVMIYKAKSWANKEEKLHDTQ